MTHLAFAGAIASRTAHPRVTPGRTSRAGATSLRPSTVANTRQTGRPVPASRLQFCGGGDANGGNGDGDGGNWRPDGTPDDSGGNNFAADGTLMTFMDKLLRGSSPAAALAGYSVSSLLEERNTGGLHLLSSPDFKEAGLVGLFGFVVHGLGGSCFYQLLDEIVAGSTPIPVVIKTCIDALIFLPLVAETFDKFTRFASSSDAPDFLKFMQRREHSSVHLLRKRALWVPAQAISFWFLPPWWRVGYVSIIMVFISFLQLFNSSHGTLLIS